MMEEAEDQNKAVYTDASNKSRTGRIFGKGLLRLVRRGWLALLPVKDENECGRIDGKSELLRDLCKPREPAIEDATGAGAQWSFIRACGRAAELQKHGRSRAE